MHAQVNLTELDLTDPEPFRSPPLGVWVTIRRQHPMSGLVIRWDGRPALLNKDGVNVLDNAGSVRAWHEAWYGWRAPASNSYGHIRIGLDTAIETHLSHRGTLAYQRMTLQPNGTWWPPTTPWKTLAPWREPDAVAFQDFSMWNPAERPSKLLSTIVSDDRHVTEDANWVVTNIPVHRLNFVYRPFSGPSAVEQMTEVILHLLEEGPNDARLTEFHQISSPDDLTRFMLPTLIEARRRRQDRMLQQAKTLLTPLQPTAHERNTGQFAPFLARHFRVGQGAMLQMLESLDWPGATAALLEHQERLARKAEQEREFEQRRLVRQADKPAEHE